jgi:hypothetical protein
MSLESSIQEIIASAREKLTIIFSRPGFFSDFYLQPIH